MQKKMEYIGEEKREVPQHGVYEPGDVVDYNKSLHNTGFFRVIKKEEKKAGDK